MTRPKLLLSWRVRDISSMIFVFQVLLTKCMAQLELRATIDDR